MNEAPRLKIGSRGSQLALWQSRHLARKLNINTDTIHVIKTRGDLFLNQPLQKQNDKGFFTKEIEDALLNRDIDLAVHSLKDLPTELPAGLCLGALTKRMSASDCLLVHPDRLDKTKKFPVAENGKIGATSLRRQSLLRKYAPHTEAAFLRGNVPTRIEKLRQGEYDAIILAKAGIARLELDVSDLHVFELDPLHWIPAAGQGVLGVEIRTEDTQTAHALLPVIHSLSTRETTIERTLLARFEGGCHTAFGAFACINNRMVSVVLGQEDLQGRWIAASVVADTDEIAIDDAFAALTNALKSEQKANSRKESPLTKPYILRG